MKFARAGLCGLALIVAACSGSKGSGFGGPNDGTGDGTGNGTSPGAFGGSGDGGAPAECNPGPSNYDVPGDGCDNDGDGTVDNPATCDSSLPANGDASAFVQALGICQMADDTHWGLVSAKYTNGYGDTGSPGAGQHNIASSFGSAITPREGASLAVIGTGYATAYDDSGNTLGSKSSLHNGMFKNNSAAIGNGSKVPAGYPKAASGCPGPGGGFGNATNDVIDVSITLKAPANAQGVAFDFDFYSGEWPDFVCSAFNDSFIAFLNSSAFNGGKADNMSFDSKNNPVSVNNGFFDRCTAGADLGCSGNTLPDKSVCAGGESELKGTGFYDFAGDYGSCNGGVGTTSSGGATGWLTSQAPVKGGETITLDFMIWNTGDEAYDSSVLLDNLTWVPGPVTTGTSRPR
ncbi:MAG: choice-of-anchor L domain-containing protein [Polyangiaceae bacterium]